MNTGALGEIRTRTPLGATPSRWCVYRFHHQGMLNLESRVGFEPTSGFRPPGLQSGALDQLGHRDVGIGGEGRPRTCDLPRMKGPLFQLSYVTDEIWRPRSRFERTTFSLQGSCATGLRYRAALRGHVFNRLGVAGEVRTRNHWGHIPGLWPIELRPHLSSRRRQIGA
jgi:hypothetical protein